MKFNQICSSGWASRLTVLLSAVLGAVFSVQAEVPVRSDVPLKSGWRIQPATDPAVAPSDKEWGEAPAEQLLDWRQDRSVNAQGLNWQKADRKKIHSLWCENSFVIPVGFEKKKIRIDFPRIEGDAIVFVNNQQVGEVLAPGGALDVSRQVSFGTENRLRIFVTRDYTGISRSFERDAVRYDARGRGSSPLPKEQWPLGITAPPLVMIRNAEAITDVFCITSWREKSLELQVEISSEKEWTGGRLQVEILDQEGNSTLQMSETIAKVPSGVSLQRLRASWRNPVLWELGRPYLYKARVKLMNNTGVIDQFDDVTFGFREVWVEGRKIFLNGHPSNWRLTDLYGATANAIPFYQQMGYNVGQIQPHPKLWWRDISDTPLFDESLLNAADQRGMGCTMPAPGISYLGSFLDNPQIQAGYDQELQRHMRRYRNHPSILAWAYGMNVYNPVGNIAPATMGKRETDPPGRGRIVQAAYEHVKKADPTRLAFSHGDGSLGDISSANVYLNFVPLQEREEWPMEWANHGDMPYSAVEFGQPFEANFWKGKQFLLTEYLAMYLGDVAYEKESADGLRQTVDFGISNKNGFGVWSRVMESVDSDGKFLFPAYWDFQRLFVGNTNRAWRTWGVNAGRLHWILSTGYGNPPGIPASARPLYANRYKFLQAPAIERPSWVNPNFDIHQQANKPLLIYIGGFPIATDKTHSVYSGEVLKKQLIAIYDGLEERDLRAEWRLEKGASVLARGVVPIQLKTGEQKVIPLSLAIPAGLTQRMAANLKLEVWEKDQVVVRDDFSVQIFPKPEPIGKISGCALYDPVGKTREWLSLLGVKPTEWKPGNSLKDVEILIVGREALKAGQAAPYSAEDIKRGLRVILFEQQPVVWEMLGFDTIETMPRYVFPRDLHGPMLVGVEPEDLVNWQGSPDLLPECKQARTYDQLHAPKWTNRHAVASVALKVPEVVGFTPLLETEFDLSYSPLIEYRYGKGVLYFCSLDLCSRVGVDPAATLMATNLLKIVQLPLAETRSVFYAGAVSGKALLEFLKVDLQSGVPTASSGGLVIVGPNNKTYSQEKLTQFVGEGGVVFHLLGDGMHGFKTSQQNLFRVKSSFRDASLWRAIGPNLLRWRDALNVNTFDATGQPAGCEVDGDGIVLVRKQGKGESVYLQVSSDLLRERYLDDSAKRESIQLSISRLNQLTARLLTNLGAGSSSSVARRLSQIRVPQTHRTLGGWKVLGPFYLPEDEIKVKMMESLSGESDALTGGENPNLTYTTSDGRTLDWRKVVEPNDEGYVDLAKDLKAEKPGIAYVTRVVVSDRMKMTRLRLGADYWLRAWVNGREVFHVDEGHGSPKAWAFQVDVPLNAGTNVITLKIGSGTKGFGFWASMSDSPSVTSATEAGEVDGVVEFYRKLEKPFDPYQFHYW